MRILVTGATGGIGSVAVSHLRSKGHDVTEFDRCADPDRPDLVVGEATDAKLVRSTVEGHDAVVHLAAIQPSMGEQHEVFATNTQSTFVVLDAAAKAGITKVVLASSISALGMPWSPFPVQAVTVPIDEDHPLLPAEAYGLSKVVDEATAAMMYRAHQMTTIALRFPATTSRQILQDRADRVTTDTTEAQREMWAYLDVRDAARSIRLALETPVAPGAYVLNIVAPDTLSDVPTARLVEDHHPDAEILAPVAGTDSAFTVDRAQHLIGFTAKYLRRGEDHE